MSHTLRFLTRLAVVAFSLCAFAPPAGFALCIDADGHLVIEAADGAGSGRCCTKSDATDPECGPADCATCQDLVIAEHIASRDTEAGATDASTSAVAATSAPILLVPMAAAPRHQAAASSTSPPLRNTPLRL